MLAALQCPTEEQVRAHLENGPLLMTRKWDGIRTRVKDGSVLTGKEFKLIKNRHIRDSLRTIDPDLDGELVCYDAEGNMCDFNSTQSCVMSFNSERAWRFHVFDAPDINDDYQGRIGWMHRHVPALKHPNIELAEVTWCFTYEEVQAYVQDCIDNGFEGAIGRTRTSPYKEGRATLREGYAMKFKPLEDAEGLCTNWTPYYRNTATPTTNAAGLQRRAKRIETQELVPGMFGALELWTEEWGIILVGTGFTDLQRCNPKQFINKTITYTFQRNHSKDKPHAARFKAVRECF